MGGLIQDCAHPLDPMSWLKDRRGIPGRWHRVSEGVLRSLGGLKCRTQETRLGQVRARAVGRSAVDCGLGTEAVGCPPNLLPQSLALSPGPGYLEESWSRL